MPRAPVNPLGLVYRGVAARTWMLFLGWTPVWMPPLTVSHESDCHWLSAFAQARVVFDSLRHATGLCTGVPGVMIDDANCSSATLFFSCTLPFTGCSRLTTSASLCIEPFGQLHIQSNHAHARSKPFGIARMQPWVWVIRCNLGFGQCHGRQRSRTGRVMQRLGDAKTLGRKVHNSFD